MNAEDPALRRSWNNYYHYFRASIKVNRVLSGLSVFITTLIHLLPPIEALYRFLYLKLIKHEKIDVLFAAPSTDKIKQFQKLIDCISSHGLSVAVVDRNNRIRDALKYLLWPCKQYVPNGMLFYDKYAGWLVDRYQPKIVLIVENAGLFPCVMHKRINSRNGHLINIAHGVGFHGISHSCIDEDYTFVFGQSTIDGLKQNPFRIGSTSAVITGSPFINADKQNTTKLTLSSKDGPVVIAAQYIPPWEDYESAVLQSRDIIHEYIRNAQNQTFIIKPHPNGNLDVWSDVMHKHANVQLSNGKNITDVLTGASLMLHMSSNTSIEAGMIGVPSIAIDPCNKSQHLFHDKYLFKVSACEELNKAVSVIFNSYEEYQRRAHQHADYLVGYRDDANSRIANKIKGLINGEVIRGEMISDSNWFLENQY